MHARWPVLAVALTCGVAAWSGCSKPIDLKQALQVTDVSTGWFDAGIVDGKNKLVPSITFRLKKAADSGVSSPSLNLVFKLAGEADGNDEFLQRVEFVNGTETAPITVRSKYGYTGDPPQSRADMLKNSTFKDMIVTLFAKESSSQWVALRSEKIERQILKQ
jgi:hypothetical protein